MRRCDFDSVLFWILEGTEIFGLISSSKCEMKIVQMKSETIFCNKILRKSINCLAYLFLNTIARLMNMLMAMIMWRMAMMMVMMVIVNDIW